MTTPFPGPRFGVADLATGVRLRYAATGPAGGEPVLFLHGITDSWLSFAPVLPRLPGSVLALAPSQRGHGDSERPPGGYTVDAFAADAVAFLDAMGVGRATVVGHSMGSAVARRMAAAYPERVARLVLAGAFVAVRSAGTLALRAEMEALADPVPEAFARDFQASTIHRPVPAAFLDAVVAESVKVPASVWRAALDGLLADDGAADLGRVAAPALLLWGDRDDVFPREEQDRLRALLPGAVWQVYAETGHALHWEEPARFVADLLAFLAATPAVQATAPAEAV